MSPGRNEGLAQVGKGSAWYKEGIDFKVFDQAEHRGREKNG